MLIALSDVIVFVEYNSSSSFVCWKDDDVILKSLMARVQTQTWMKSLKMHKKLETQSMWLRFGLFVLFS